MFFIRSYGSVFKARHKQTGEILAIKTVPVDTDLQEIIKEITIMQQCDSPYIVKYFGSYFKNSDLWVSFRLFIHLAKLNRVAKINHVDLVVEPILCGFSCFSV